MIMFHTAPFRNQCKIVLCQQEPRVLLFSFKNDLQHGYFNYVGTFLNES